MIKIITGKEYEKMSQMLVDLQMDLNDAKGNNAILEEQVEYLRKELKKEVENNQTLSNLLDKQEVKLKSKTNDIRKLKTYMTQNNIDYSVILEKKEK